MNTIQYYQEKGKKIANIVMSFCINMKVIEEFILKWKILIPSPEAVVES